MCCSLAGCQAPLCARCAKTWPAHPPGRQSSTRPPCGLLRVRWENGPQSVQKSASKSATTASPSLASAPNQGRALTRLKGLHMATAALMGVFSPSSPAGQAEAEAGGIGEWPGRQRGVGVAADTRLARRASSAASSPLESLRRLHQCTPEMGCPAGPCSGVPCPVPLGLAARALQPALPTQVARHDVGSQAPARRKQQAAGVEVAHVRHYVPAGGAAGRQQSSVPGRRTPTAPAAAPMQPTALVYLAAPMPLSRGRFAERRCGSTAQQRAQRLCALRAHNTVLPPGCPAFAIQPLSAQSGPAPTHPTPPPTNPHRTTPHHHTHTHLPGSAPHILGEGRRVELGSLHGAAAGAATVEHHRADARLPGMHLQARGGRVGCGGERMGVIAMALCGGVGVRVLRECRRRGWLQACRRGCVAGLASASGKARAVQLDWSGS